MFKLLLQSHTVYPEFAISEIRKHGWAMVEKEKTYYIDSIFLNYND